MSTTKVCDKYCYCSLVADKVTETESKAQAVAGAQWEAGLEVSFLLLSDWCLEETPLTSDCSVSPSQPWGKIGQDEGLLPKTSLECLKPALGPSPHFVLGTVVFISLFGGRKMIQKTDG